MSLQNPLIYAAFLLLSGLVAITVAILTYPRRKAPGGSPLILMMAAMVVWSWTYALHWVSPKWPAPFFWLDATYFGVVAVPGLVLLFALELHQQKSLASRRLFFLLALEPILTLAFLWTDPYHHLFYGSLRTPDTNDIFSGGPWFWVNAAYSYALTLVTYVYLFRTFFRSRGEIYRKQVAVSIAGLLLSLLVNLSAFAGFHPLPGLDLTPILFTITGLFFGASLRTYHLFDLVPVAKSTLLDQMQDGMIVLDAQQRMVEMNQSAAVLFGAPLQQLIGCSWPEVCRRVPGLEQHLLPLHQGGAQVALPGQPGRVLDISVSPLTPSHGRPAGFLIAWRDITALMQVESNLRLANQTLRQQLLQIDMLRTALEEQVIRDPLTGLFNRRFLENILPGEFARANRSAIPVALMIIDVDHFKNINDQFGHDTGDQVLKHLAHTLEASIRKGDWAIRYGGEEFLLVMMGIDGQTAVDRAGQMHGEIEKMGFPTSNGELHITISTGIALFPDHGPDYENVFHAADNAMYQAKATGRNRVVVYSAGPVGNEAA